MEIFDDDGDGTISFTLGVWGVSLFCGLVYLTAMGLLTSDMSWEFWYFVVAATVVAGLFSVPVVLIFAFVVQNIQKRKASTSDKKWWLTMFGTGGLVVAFLFAWSIFDLSFEAVLGHLIGIPLGIWYFDLKEIED